MKKIFVSILLAVGLSGIANAARYEQLNVGELSLAGSQVTATAAELNRLDGGSMTQNNLTVLTNTVLNTVTTSGKVTAGEEIEVNGAASTVLLDINGANTNNIITIDVTNTAGKNATAFITVNDAVTGTYGNDTNEPFLKIISARAYAQAILEGLMYCKDGFEGPGSSLTDLSAANITAGGAISAINGLAITNLSGANLASGNVPEARLTNAAATLGDDIGGNIPVAAVTNLLAGTSYTIDGARLAGEIAVARITNAATTVGPSIGGNIPVAAITNAATTVGSSIGGNIPVAAMTNGAGTLGASIGGNIPYAAMSNGLASYVPSKPLIVIATNDGTNATGYIQTRNIAGGVMAEQRILRVWNSETAYGAASTARVESIVLSGGTAIQTVTANADYKYATGATGTNGIAFNVQQAGSTNYIMVSDGGSVTSTAAIVFAGP